MGSQASSAGTLGAPATRRRPSPSRRLVITAALQAGGTVVALVAVYYLLPLDGRLTAGAGMALAVALAAFVGLGVVQVRNVLRAPYPGLRAMQVVATMIPLFIITFASYYYVVARHAPDSFSDRLTRTDALYFTVTVLATVGFGDIVARSEGARIAVTVQMVADLAVLGVLVRTIVRAVTHGWERQDRERSEPP